MFRIILNNFIYCEYMLLVLREIILKRLGNIPNTILARNADILNGLDAFWKRFKELAQRTNLRF